MERLRIEILIEDLTEEIDDVNNYKKYLSELYDKFNSIKEKEEDYFTAERIGDLKKATKRAKEMTKLLKKEMRLTREFLYNKWQEQAKE